MRAPLTFLLVVFSGTASAQTKGPGAPGVDGAIDRGLAFLARDAVAWKAEHGCVSCHHAGLVVWAMREAEERGRKVDEPVLDDLTKWVAESGDGKTGLPRPAGRPRKRLQRQGGLAGGSARLRRTRTPSPTPTRGRAWSASCRR